MVSGEIRDPRIGKFFFERSKERDFGPRFPALNFRFLWPILKWLTYRKIFQRKAIMANKREDSKLKIAKDAITQDWKRRQGKFDSLIGWKGVPQSASPLNPSQFFNLSWILVIHRLRVYQFEKQKGHLIIPPEEGPEICYPERKISNFILRKSRISDFFGKKIWNSPQWYWW